MTKRAFIEWMITRHGESFVVGCILSNVNKEAGLYIDDRDLLHYLEAHRVVEDAPAECGEMQAELTT